MNTVRLFVAALLLAGCEPPGPKGEVKPNPADTGRSEKPAAPATKPKATAKIVELAKNVSLEVQADGTRRVLIPAEVCFREGPLELLLCRKFTKEHESVLVADIDARELHKALIVAGAVPGAPAKFEPKFQPPRGTAIRMTLKYTEKGQEKAVDAREWVRDSKTRKQLEKDWVFGGSYFFTPHEVEGGDDKSGKGKAAEKQLYAANGGDIVCVANFGTAMLDVPTASSAENEELMFEAFTEKIPPLGTKVTIVFEPLPEKKTEKTKQ